MINTNHRMCLPSLPVEDFVQAVKAIVSFDQDWVPHAEGTSLYIRPFVIATEPHLGCLLYTSILRYLTTKH